MADLIIAAKVKNTTQVRLFKNLSKTWQAILTGGGCFIPAQETQYQTLKAISHVISIWDSLSS